MEKSTREKIFSEVVKKVLLYSSEKSTNLVKLIKYLSLIRQQQLSLNGVIEKNLRKLGVLEALMLLFNRQVNDCESDHNKSSTKPLADSTKSTLTTGLSILGNAFAVDPESRRQAQKLKFVLTIKYFLQSQTFSSHPDILSRALKCLANLAVNNQLCDFILRDGIGICIVYRLKEIYTRLTNGLEDDDKINEIIIEKGEETILCQAARAIRIFSSDFEFQQHLTRFGALVGLGNFLKFSYNQILFADILKALAVLTTSMKKIPLDILKALTDSEKQKPVPYHIIKILKSRNSTKCVSEPAIICLTQLAYNTSLAKTLVHLDLIEVALQAIKQTDDVDRLEKLLRLLVVLTQESPASMDCNLSHRLRLSCCSQLGETLKVLQMAELKHYHTWILKIYENLYEDKLKDLVNRGIIDILDQFLREKLGDYSFENLSKKLASRDEDTCNVHTTWKDSKCPFSPKYRCTSPTYQLVQDIEKRNAKSTETSNVLNTQVLELNTLSSPYSSPPHSPGDYGERYAFFGTYSPSTSPVYSRQFHFSPESSSCSEDEGIGSSSTNISPCQSPATCHGSPSKNIDNQQSGASTTTEYSEDECEETDVKMETENPESHPDDFEPPKKRLKFNSIGLTQPDSGATTTDDTSMNMENEEDEKDADYVKKDVDTIIIKSDNLTLQQIRNRYGKIVSILGILNRAAHFTSVPAKLTKFLPFLFEVIWSTRISVEKAEENNKRLEHADELLPLGSLCFQRSFKIVTRICSDINTFPSLVENGVIPLVYRILLYNCRVRESDENQIIFNRNPYRRNPQPNHQTTMAEFINTYSVKLMETLVGISGSENQSFGWRQCYFLRTCCVPGQRPSTGNNYINAILSIPLLYRGKSHIYREFEEKTGNWEKIFELLTNVDDIQFSQFQNCILALMCIVQTKGLTWTEAENASKQNLLYPESTITTTDDGDPTNSNQNVVFELDDGSTMTLGKKCLTDASPVFSAMFDGHFREAGEQRVNLRQTSRSALNALAMQILQQSQTEKQPNDSSPTNETTTEIQNNTNQIVIPFSTKVNLNYELSTLFELLSLCDQFLLDNLYERTLNTLIGFYICPFSAPAIYAESLTFGGLHKSDTQLSSVRNLKLTRLALKYLLVGEDICLTLRAGALWKIFDTTLPSVVVQDLREILNFKIPN